MDLQVLQYHRHIHGTYKLKMSFEIKFLKLNAENFRITKLA